MLANKMTMIINTCDKFSDLWDCHMLLLDKNWSNRDFKVILATDCVTERFYRGVEIVSAGEDKQMPQRIAAALKDVETEYILITLDDYFPIYPVDSLKITHILDEMDKLNLDYVRLFKRPNSVKKISNSDLYEINLWSKKDFHYQVNLYAGIWRKSFLEQTLKNTGNAWEYETTLSKIAREVNARCAMSKGKEFETLDVVRKGQLLHKAARYLKKHGMYDGPRTVISWKEELRIIIFTFIKDIMPQFVIDFGKGILRKRGYTFYSDSVK
jgi:hypothetical protein